MIAACSKWALERISRSVGTVWRRRPVPRAPDGSRTETIDPSLRAVTTTPSIGPSASELTWPASAAGADGVATLPFNRPDRLNALSTPIMEGLLEALPRLALGCRRRKGLTTLLAERHARHLAGEHKLCETPANQCTLTLLPFDLKLYKRTSLERRRHCSTGFAAAPPIAPAMRLNWRNRGQGCRR